MPEYVFDDDITPEEREAFLAEKGEGPSAITRAYQAVAHPVTRAATAVLKKGITAPGEAIAAGLTKAGVGLPGVPFRPGMETPEAAAAGARAGEAAAEPIARTAAEMAIPQTPAELGMMAGLGVAGRAAAAIPRAARFVRGGLRATGATAGGALGAAAAGEPVLPEVAPGAIAGGVTELLTPATAAAAGAVPGVRGAVARGYARRVAGAIRDILPEVKKLGTAEDFTYFAKAARELKMGGKTRIGLAMDQADAAIRKQLGSKKLSLTSYTPEAPPAPTVRTTAAKSLEEAQMESAREMVKREMVTRGVKGPSEVTYDQAVGELRRLERKGWTEEKAGKGDLAEKSREAANALRMEITQRLNEVSPKLGQAFDRRQRMWAQGLELAKEVSRAVTAARPGTPGFEPALQKAAVTRLGRAGEVFKHEPAALEQWHRTVFRGEPVQPPVPEGIQLPWMRVGGAPVHIRIGGGVPSPGDLLQTLLDLAAIRTTEQVRPR